MHILDGLFAPKSVVIIGASASPEKVGAILLANILSSGYAGDIYLVNPHETQIGDRTCFPSISALPVTPDLGIIAIPGAVVNSALTEIGKKGIKNVVILSAGFKEMGGDGVTREKEMADIANTYGIHILGPNCMGFVNESVPINATFAHTPQDPGTFCFISQSGAIASSLFDYCQKTGLGFREVFSIGNKVNTGENEILDYLLSQEKISDTPRPIGLYLESIIDGKQFVNVASKVSRRDPIFILKPGKSNASKKAMQSHTGAIAGEDAVLSAALMEAGITRCDGLEDFFDYIRAYSWGKVPQGKKIVIISNAGGPAVMTSDDVIAQGLEFFQFDDATTANMNALLPAFASTHNPIDVLGDALADRFQKIGEIVMATPGIDMVLVILTPQMMTQVPETAQIVADLAKKYDTPIFCSFIGGEKVEEAEKVFNMSHVVNFPYPERAIKILAGMQRWYEWHSAKGTEQSLNDHEIAIDTQAAQGIVHSAKGNNQPSLSNTDANDLLDAYGIKTPPTMVVNTLDEAKVFVTTQDFPVVLKLSAPGLVHKAAVGGVVANIHSIDTLSAGWESIITAKEKLDPSMKVVAQIQIQKQINDGIEVIAGIKRDPVFGPVLLFGMGGKYVEFIHDRNLHLLPITQEIAMELITSSQAYLFLKPASDHTQYAIEKLADVLVKLSALFMSCPDIQEMEINPIIVTSEDAWGVDGKVLLQEAAG